MNFDQAKQTFIIEAEELLASMEDALLAVEGEVDTGESINAMFRAVHTIKGSAGLFGLDAIVHFAHTVESVLDRVRSHQMSLSRELVALFLECHDHLAQLIGQIQTNEEESPESKQTGERLISHLTPHLGTQSADAKAASSAKLLSRPEDQASGECSGHDCWHLSLRFSRDALRNGMDPLSFVRYLETLGNLVQRTPILEDIPTGDAFDPESCYFGIELDLHSEASRQTLEDVFEFVHEGSHIRIIPPQAKTAEYVQLIRELPGQEQRLGQILVASGCITSKDLEEALGSQRKESAGDPPSKARKIGTILVEDQAVPPPVVAAALDKQKKAQERQSSELKVIKVAADKLDRLVDLVGELVIAGAAAHASAAQTNNGALIETTAVMNKLVEEIRDNALSLRMVQIGDTFSRFRRIVRDVSQELGKSIELEVHGAETELDKSIVEKLSDPLMHIVRNAIDHGIEPLELRRERGKPDVGSLMLNAFHESGSIVIEVSDDGGGLNKDRILAKAIERGLVAEGASLSDSEITSLIFEPGFSTASSVSNLSGRGVGMDVVRRNIDELRGTVEVESYEGAGTTLRIRLPLTLAIIDGFRVGVEDTCYVVPLEMVIECLDLGPFLESEENHLINLRGEVLPFLRLREIFGIPGHAERERVVVVQFGDIRAGLVVDKLLGEFQTVIKPLGELFRHIKGIGGSTILGSGEVALILDVAQLIHLTSETRRYKPVGILPTHASA